MPVPEFRLAFPYPDAAVIELPRWQQPDSRTRNALIRSLRGLGERGLALLTQTLDHPAESVRPRPEWVTLPSSSRIRNLPKVTR